MEEVAAVGQLPELVRRLVVRQADRTAGGVRRAVAGSQPGLRRHRLPVEQPRVAPYGGLVKAHIDPHGLLLEGRPRLAGRAAADPVGTEAAGAEVGGESDGGDEEEDPDGDADSVPEAADVLPAAAGAAAGAGRFVHVL